jgi:hypothetical protein
MSESPTPTLADVLLRLARQNAGALRVGMPGKVLSYDPVRQAVEVQPMILRGFDDESGERQVETLAAIEDVPVQFDGAGGYSETYPLSPGDTVWLTFSDFCLNQYLLTGEMVDPRDDRQHSISDAVAVPGVRPFKRALRAVPTDAWTITVPTGKRVLLGDSSASADGARVATKSSLDAIMTALNTAITALGADPSASALTALRTALTNAGFPVCATKTGAV